MWLTWQRVGGPQEMRWKQSRGMVPVRPTEQGSGGAAYDDWMAAQQQRQQQQHVQQQIQMQQAAHIERLRQQQWQQRQYQMQQAQALQDDPRGPVWAGQRDASLQQQQQQQMLRRQQHEQQQQARLQEQLEQQLARQQQQQLSHDHVPEDLSDLGPLPLLPKTGLRLCPPVSCFRGFEALFSQLI